LNTQTASLLSYTSSNNTTNTSQNTRLSALEAATASLYTTTASFNASIASLNTQTASLNASVAGLNTYTSSLNARTASFATTGSNTFTGRQYISDTSQATSFTQTASFYTDGGLRVSKDAYVSGTLYLNNLTVFGTQSVAYISSSQLNIGTNIITVNTDTPTIRFGGLAVYDSGSTRLTGSILWDSQDNQWIYSNPSGSAYDSAMFLVGPRNSGSLGNEVGITTNALSKGDGMHHMTSSGIIEDGSRTCFYGTSLIVSSSGAVNVAGPFNSTQDIIVNGVNIGEGGGNIASNVRVGLSALSCNTTGANNTAVGICALRCNTIGTGNVAVGANSLSSNTIGIENTAIGLNTLYSNRN
jgi:hypothetical protein